MAGRTRWANRLRRTWAFLPTSSTPRRLEPSVTPSLVSFCHKVFDAGVSGCGCGTVEPSIARSVAFSFLLLRDSQEMIWLGRMAHLHNLGAGLASPWWAGRQAGRKVRVHLHIGAAVSVPTRAGDVTLTPWRHLHPHRGRWEIFQEMSRWDVGRQRHLAAPDATDRAAIKRKNFYFILKKKNNKKLTSIIKKKKYNKTKGKMGRKK